MTIALKFSIENDWKCYIGRKRRNGADENNKGKNTAGYKFLNMRFQQLVYRTVPHSLVEWLRCELEKRGIDCAYTHCLLSTLQEDFDDTESDDCLNIKNHQQKIYQKYGGPDNLFLYKEKRQKWKTYKNFLLTTNTSSYNTGISDLERRKRNFAINLLQSVSDDNTIEDLIDDLSVKLKNIKNLNDKEDSIKCLGLIEENTQFYIPPSSPTDQVEKYFAAFPPLDGKNDEKKDSTERIQLNYWHTNYLTKLKTETNAFIKNQMNDNISGQRYLSQSNPFKKFKPSDIDSLKVYQETLDTYFEEINKDNLNEKNRVSISKEDSLTNNFSEKREALENYTLNEETIINITNLYKEINSEKMTEKNKNSCEKIEESKDSSDTYFNEKREELESCDNLNEKNNKKISETKQNSPDTYFNEESSEGKLREKCKISSSKKTCKSKQKINSLAQKIDGSKTESQYRCDYSCFSKQSKTEKVALVNNVSQVKSVDTDEESKPHALKMILKVPDLILDEELEAELERSFKEYTDMRDAILSRNVDKVCTHGEMYNKIKKKLKEEVAGFLDSFFEKAEKSSKNNVLLGESSETNILPTELSTDVISSDKSSKSSQVSILPDSQISNSVKTSKKMNRKRKKKLILCDKPSEVHILPNLQKSSENIAASKKSTEDDILHNLPKSSSKVGKKQGGNINTSEKLSEKSPKDKILPNKPVENINTYEKSSGENIAASKKSTEDDILHNLPKSSSKVGKKRGGNVNTCKKLSEKSPKDKILPKPVENINAYEKLSGNKVLPNKPVENINTYEKSSGENIAASKKSTEDDILHNLPKSSSKVGKKQGGNINTSEKLSEKSPKDKILPNKPVENINTYEKSSGENIAASKKSTEDDILHNLPKSSSKVGKKRGGNVNTCKKLSEKSPKDKILPKPVENINAYEKLSGNKVLPNKPVENINTYEKSSGENIAASKKSTEDHILHNLPKSSSKVGKKQGGNANTSEKLSKKSPKYKILPNKPVENINRYEKSSGDKVLPKSSEADILSNLQSSNSVKLPPKISKKNKKNKNKKNITKIKEHDKLISDTCKRLDLDTEVETKSLADVCTRSAGAVEVAASQIMQIKAQVHEEISVKSALIHTKEEIKENNSDNTQISTDTSYCQNKVENYVYDLKNDINISTNINEHEFIPAISKELDLDTEVQAESFTNVGVHNVGSFHVAGSQITQIKAEVHTVASIESVLNKESSLILSGEGIKENNSNNWQTGFDTSYCKNKNETLFCDMKNDVEELVHISEFKNEPSSANVTEVPFKKCKDSFDKSSSDQMKYVNVIADQETSIVNNVVSTSPYLEENVKTLKFSQNKICNVDTSKYYNSSTNNVCYNDDSRNLLEKQKVKQSQIISHQFNSNASCNKIASLSSILSKTVSDKNGISPGENFDTLKREPHVICNSSLQSEIFDMITTGDLHEAFSRLKKEYAGEINLDALFKTFYQNLISDSEDCIHNSALLNWKVTYDKASDASHDNAVSSLPAAKYSPLSPFSSITKTKENSGFLLTNNSHIDKTDESAELSVGQNASKCDSVAQECSQHFDVSNYPLSTDYTKNWTGYSNISQSDQLNYAFNDLTERISDRDKNILNVLPRLDKNHRQHISEQYFSHPLYINPGDKYMEISQSKTVEKSICNFKPSNYNYITDHDSCKKFDFEKCIPSPEINYDEMHLFPTGTVETGKQVCSVKSFSISSDSAFSHPDGLLKKQTVCDPKYCNQKLLKKTLISIDRIILKVHARNTVAFHPLPSNINYKNVLSDCPKSFNSRMYKNVESKWESPKQIKHIWKNDEASIDDKIPYGISPVISQTITACKNNTEQKNLRNLYSAVDLNDKATCVEEQAICSNTYDLPYIENSENIFLNKDYINSVQFSVDNFLQDKTLSKTSDINEKLNFPLSVPHDTVDVNLDNYKNSGIGLNDSSSTKKEAYHDSNINIPSAFLCPCRSYNETKKIYLEDGSWNLSIYPSYDFCELSSSPNDLISTEEEITQLSSASPSSNIRRGTTHKYLPFKRPCTYFLEGKCNRVDCKYSHNLSTITCRFWLNGSCFKGSTCPFLHGYVEEQKSFDQQLIVNTTELNYSLDSETDFPSLSPAKFGSVPRSKPVDIVRKKERIQDTKS